MRRKHLRTSENRRKRGYEHLHQRVHDGERATLLKPFEMCSPCAMKMRNEHILYAEIFCISKSETWIELSGFLEMHTLQISGTSSHFSSAS